MCNKPGFVFKADLFLHYVDTPQGKMLETPIRKINYPFDVYMRSKTGEEWGCPHKEKEQNNGQNQTKNQ